MAAGCLEVQELIPWVVNHSASPGEQRSLHQHIAACTDCRREFVRAVAFQRRVREWVASLPPSQRACPDALPGAAREHRPPSVQTIERIARLLEVTGVPLLVASGLRLTMSLATSRPSLRLKLPLLASIDAR